MQYLCLVTTSSEAFLGFTDADGLKLTEESLAYNRLLERNGNMILARALLEPQTAVTISRRRGELSTTDGPYAETTEHVAGFVLLEADSQAQAVELAGNIPMARFGKIEVRGISW